MILIFGRTSDIHASAVSWALQQMDCTSELLDLHHLLAGGMLSLGEDMDSVSWRRAEGESVRNIVLSQVDCAWMRRIDGHDFDASRLHPDDVENSSAEFQRLSRSLYGLVALRAKFPVNGIHSKFHCELKPVQLWRAMQAGLNVPRTLISNDPASVGRFIGSNQKSIFKPFEQSSWYRDEKAIVHRTHMIDGRLLDIADSITLSPGQYQSYVEKAYELRLTVMGDEIIAAKLDTQSVESARVDWKDDVFERVRVTPYVLPDKVKAKVSRFMESMGLDFGCVDLVVTPEGEYVFLEVNPQGQFLWIEQRNPEIRMLESFSRYLCRHAGLRPASGHISLADYLESEAWRRCMAYRKRVDEGELRRRA